MNVISCSFIPSYLHCPTIFSVLSHCLSTPIRHKWAFYATHVFHAWCVSRDILGSSCTEIIATSVEDEYNACKQRKKKLEFSIQDIPLSFQPDRALKVFVIVWRARQFSSCFTKYLSTVKICSRVIFQRRFTAQRIHKLKYFSNRKIF